MNIAVILSGGKGKRFGANLPKQYLNLRGKPVIDYVVEAVLESSSIDEIVIVIDEEYKKYVGKINNSKIHTVPNGKERVYSVENALKYIKKNFPECNNIIITQAVSPMITKNIIDEYIKLLDEYDVVTTATKCPGEIFNVNDYKPRERDNYYFCQSPEAFKFNDLYQNLDTNSKFSELIYHYPKKPNIMFYTKFKDNVKLTFQSDLDYCEFLVRSKEEK